MDMSFVTTVQTQQGQDAIAQLRVGSVHAIMLWQVAGEVLRQLRRLAKGR